MTTFIVLPLVASAAALIGSFAGFRGVICGVAVAYGAAALCVML